MAGESFAEFMDGALYDDRTGFYATAGRAGRRADFLTSPEVGPLFGAVLARVVDRVWHELGAPDPFVVVDAGAGPGTLARSMRVADPECAPALRYVLVERSASQRALHAEHLDGWVGEPDDIDAWVGASVGGSGPAFASSARMPSAFDGVIIANELLDNIAFDVVRRVDGRHERIEMVDGEPTAVPIDAVPLPFCVDDRLPDGVWLPDQTRARAWVGDALASLGRGRLVVVDYGATTAELATRGDLGWMRTYRGQSRGSAPFDDPGTQDITADVAIDQLTFDLAPAVVVTQAEYLRDAGIDELVAEGRRQWSERVVTDVAALRARSRVTEAEALCDPAGLGGFLVAHWQVGPGSPPTAVR